MWTPNNLSLWVVQTFKYMGTHINSRKMNSPHADGFQCINKCNVFWTVGIPRRCPHCGTREILPTDDDITMYDKADKKFVNEHGP